MPLLVSRQLNCIQIHLPMDLCSRHLTCCSTGEYSSRQGGPAVHAGQHVASVQPAAARICLSWACWSPVCLGSCQRFSLLLFAHRFVAYQIMCMGMACKACSSQLLWIWDERLCLCVAHTVTEANAGVETSSDEVKHAASAGKADRSAVCSFCTASVQTPQLLEQYMRLQACHGLMRTWRSPCTRRVRWRVAIHCVL